MIPTVRIGMGHDRHRLGPDRPLVLGGLTIPHSLGLIGHSDADVLLHAITDALLGALALGDIGEWFPNTSEQWKDADSAVFVREAARAVHERGWQIANLDCTIHAEQPKLSAWKRPIAERIAAMLNLDPGCVSIKAKTGEKVGPVGRAEAIDAEAVVLLVRSETT